MKGPEPLLRQLKLSFEDPVRPGRPAQLDSTFRVWIGHDAYYFASHDSRERFLHDPLRYCGRLTDPVSRERFQPTRQSPRFTYRRRLYYFASEESLRRFRANPTYYAERGPMDLMQPMMPVAAPAPGK